MRWYDAQHNRLVYGGRPATADFWAQHWQQAHQIKNILTSDRTDPLIPRLTRRFLTPAATVRVLDGGCGVGQHVARLQRLGYSAFGIDYAAETVAHVNRYAPHLNITTGDVRQLPYRDNFFDGYWSIGVIEHWFDGYAACAREMARVLKPGGYLFLTFPHMSPLRQYKARRQSYPPLPPDFNTDTFYQFALDPRHVLHDFAKLGFRRVWQGRTDGLKGLKDEAALLRPPLQALYDSRWLAARVTKVAISAILAPLTGHSAVLVLQKKEA